MKAQFVSALAIAAGLLGTGQAAAIGASAPVTFSDGAVATAFDHCGDTDLCATIAYADGQTLRVYSEGAADCQPYMLHFVLLDASKRTLYEFSRALKQITDCSGEAPTEFTMDHGLIHFDVDNNRDGTLKPAFAPNVARPG